MENDSQDVQHQREEPKDPTTVEFDGPNDPGNPKNWTAKRRWCITASLGSLVFTVTFASSVFSVNIGVVQEKFDVDIVTATLGVALFVLVSLSLPHGQQRLKMRHRASSSVQLRSAPCQKS